MEETWPLGWFFQIWAILDFDTTSRNLVYHLPSLLFKAYQPLLGYPWTCWSAAARKTLLRSYIHWGSSWQFFLKSVWAAEAIQVLRVIISDFASESPTDCVFLHVSSYWKHLLGLSLCYSRVLYWFNSPIFKVDITIYYIRVEHKERVMIRAPLSQAVEKRSKGLLLPSRHHSLNRWERIEEIDTNT